MIPDWPARVGGEMFQDDAGGSLADLEALRYNIYETARPARSVSRDLAPPQALSCFVPAHRVEGRRS